jgi:hypothetical protein
LSSRLGKLSLGNQDVEDLTRDVALEAADDLLLGEALGGSAGHVVLGRLVPAQAPDDDAPQGIVGLAVAAAVESVASGRLAG